MKRLLLLLAFTTSFAYAQYADPIPHVEGQVLIMIDENENIGQVLHANQLVRGKASDLERAKLVSEPAKIWLLSFDHETVPHEEMLDALWHDKHVKIAQNNHYVTTERITTPNDPNFGQQWHHVDPQDNDIDSDEAWDITTGGLTANGDEIVVCVIEGGGANWDHTDLIDNHWTNTDEIANNGNDDDGNGYVDDVDGWNEPDNDDNISPGGHGTQVSGMIGATGNNNLLVAGINWDVKIMQVEMGSIGSGANPNEANVIAAYTYPLVMRQRYTQSGGTTGAFVVATNASWGIDAADPANAPLWCAFYDTLGANGILNCGATTNSNLDVDAVGDLPTACGSDYMISVTRTDNNDGQAGGYGATTIDLGAPGINVVTTSGSSGSGSTTGTSFSSPLTAGVIALMYSAPCASLAAMAMSNPQQAADQVRTALLNGVDPVSSLNGITVTGGRLNAYNSVMEIVNNCSATSCFDPWSVATSNVTDVQSDVSWGGNGVTYNVRYKPTASGTWTVVGGLSASPYTITGLTACTEYEVQVQSVCSGGPTDTSNYTASTVWTTDGCCEPPTTHDGTATGPTSGDVTWSNVLAATGYDLRYRPVGAGTWTDVFGATSPHNLSGLDSCTEYEVQVRTICGASTTAYTASDTMKTSGCGACEDLTYCASNGANSASEWIENITFGTINNTSGDNGGYADFTGMSTDVMINSSYQIDMTPGYSIFQYDEYWQVWIDWNQNGDFTDAGELAFDLGSAQPNAQMGNITVPASATLGVTKMRVSMRFDQSATECQTGFDFGEVEDYCVNVLAANGIGEQANLSFVMFPNPANDNVFIQLADSRMVTLSVMNALGQSVIEGTARLNATIDLSGVEAGVYFVRIRDEKGITGVKRLVVN